MITIQGFPRIGRNRELKRALEQYWSGGNSAADLEAAARAVRQANYALYHKAGLALAPSGDFSFYDRMLDTSLMLGCLPARFKAANLSGLELYFALARGTNASGLNIAPLAMRKWFNTNYHYLVPEIDEPVFQADASMALSLLREAQGAGFSQAVPSLIGPLTYAALAQFDGPIDEIALALAKPYAELIRELKAAGAERIQIEEPILVLNPLPFSAATARRVYDSIDSSSLILQTYYAEVGDNFKWISNLPTAGIGLDFVHGADNLAQLKQHGLPAGKLLVAGVIDGRNIWPVDAQSAQNLIAELQPWQPILAPSCPLLHVPYSAKAEAGVYSFAEEKLSELGVLDRGNPDDIKRLTERRQSFINDTSRHNSRLQEELAQACREPRGRLTDHAVRAEIQQRRLNLPALPTTTIGSFPQTAEIRRQRRLWREGQISDRLYQDYIKDLTAEVIEQQEQLGLDVLVHGEFERNDMVEYFGEQLDGVRFTKNGWVQSYGSRCVKPPIIYGDITRRAPMTVELSRYAQSLTAKPLKGMLTGPVTILNWSFVRDDIPREQVCRQLALAIRHEVNDLEAAGLGIIQIDEAALREGLPLRTESKQDYLSWAVECFKLASDGVRNETQIHTHMCYSEFSEIIASIVAMDADVITIENARAGQQLLTAFKECGYPNQIGPGVYDIHSPLVPETGEMIERLRRMLEVLSPKQLWVNPDCGLKTRQMTETMPALANMVAAARQLRNELGLN